MPDPVPVMVRKTFYQHFGFQSSPSDVSRIKRELSVAHAEGCDQDVITTQLPTKMFRLFEVKGFERK